MWKSFALDSEHLVEDLHKEGERFLGVEIYRI